MHTTPKRSIGWLGCIALGFGGVNLSIYTMAPLVSQYGTCVIPLFLVALTLTLISSIGYLELVLMYPNKSGGIAVACTEAFQVYNPILSNILGVSYWLAWLMAASFGALYLSTIIQQILPWISIQWFSASLIFCVTLLNLFGLRLASRVAIFGMFFAVLLTVLSVLIPLMSGHVVWKQLLNYSFISPYNSGFEQASTLIAAFYFIGWVVPAYESVLCYVGETKEPKKSIPKALYITMALAILFYGICPVIWLATLGPDAIHKELASVLSPVFEPLLGSYAKLGVVCFMIFNMLICLFAPLAGPARTLAQLAKDGLIPEFIGKTSRFNVPWVALLLTSSISICIVFLKSPSWLMATSTFQYMLCIALASVAVWLLRKNQPDAPRLYKAPKIFICLGLISASAWLTATILGFRQYGLESMIVGISFTLTGIPLYLWRKASDRIKQGHSIFFSSLHYKLTGLLFLVLVFDAIGYLVAVHNIEPSQSALIAILEDIFLLVALLTLTMGLIIPGMIAHTAEEINLAVKRIVNINLSELSAAMEALGSGDMSKVTIKSEITPIIVTTQDELGEMAVNFNHMQNEIRKTALSTMDVHKRLLGAMNELTALNKTLEARVVDRTKKFEAEKGKAEEATRIKSEFVSTVSHELRTPMTVIKASLELILHHLNNNHMEPEALASLINLAYKNANRMIRLITDILNEEKIAAGKFTLMLKNQLVLPLIKHAISSNILFAKQYNVDLELEEVIADAHADIDEDRYIQVLDNVLSNAAKFSRPYTQIKIRMQRIKGLISVSVQDTGSGFSEAFAQTIFDPFTQEKSSNARVGTGLGLNIAKSIMEQHQGTIRFKTSPKGSTFYIELPEYPPPSGSTSSRA